MDGYPASRDVATPKLTTGTHRDRSPGPASPDTLGDQFEVRSSAGYDLAIG